MAEEHESSDWAKMWGLGLFDDGLAVVLVEELVGKGTQDPNRTQRSGNVQPDPVKVDTCEKSLCRTRHSETSHLTPETQDPSQPESMKPTPVNP